ncbi:MAG: DEAD/DEAH box helicase [Alphaproteobacteria bacterium]|nr:DEAD/DEAH box helicase [Alphaproteobacteria bacterium]
MSQDFNGFGLPAKLLQSLARMKYDTPTPIQLQTIPLALEGKDVLGSAQTGTGKTAAFGIPLIVHLMNNPASTALIMTPTRELAAQVRAALEPMLPFDVKAALLIGGESMPKQFSQLNQKPNLIIGTPGRITDHLMRGTLKLERADFMVLDETDRMLDMGFGIQIDKVLTFMPKQRQTLLFSATMPANIIKLSGKYMHKPERVAVGSTTTPAANIHQELVHTTDTDKYTQLLAQLDQRKGSVIIFVKTKFGTEKLAKRLIASDHKADAIHGDLQQRRRDRVIRNFRDQRYRILVATDVAARGLDIPHIEHVINFDLPQCPEDYIHRIGRTARAGADGCAVNLLTPADGAKWKAIHRLMHGKDDPSMPASYAKPSGGGYKGRGGYKGKNTGPFKGKSADGRFKAKSGEGGYKGKPAADGGKPAWKVNKPRNKANFKPKKAA